MNLAEVRTRVQLDTDWAPESVVRRNELDATINLAEADVWGDRDWVAAGGSYSFQSLPDWTADRVDPTGLAALITLSVGRMSRRFIASAGLPFLFTDANNRTSDWTGQVVSLPTVTAVSGTGVPTLGQAEDYRIVKVASGTEVWLDRPYEGQTFASLTGWRFKKVWYVLPPHILRLTSIWLSTSPLSNAPVIELHQALGPGPDATDEPANTPRAWYEAAPALIRSGGKLTVVQTAPQGGRDDTHGIHSGRSYEFAWAWYDRDAVGPPGEPLIVTTAGTTAQFVGLSFTLLEMDGFTSPVTQAPSATETIWPLPYEGKKKVLLVNTNFDAASANPTTEGRLGPPRWAMVTRRSLNTTLSDGDTYPLLMDDLTATIAVVQSWQILPSLPRVLPREAGIAIRLYPRSDGFELANPAFQDGAGAQVLDQRVGTRVFGCHYIRRPETMCAPFDTTFPLPFEVQDLVALKATERWARRIGRADVADSALARYAQQIDSPRVMKHQKREGKRTRVGPSTTARAHDAVAGGGYGSWPDGPVYVSTNNLPTVT